MYKFNETDVAMVHDVLQKTNDHYHTPDATALKARISMLLERRKQGAEAPGDLATNGWVAFVWHGEGGDLNVTVALSPYGIFHHL